MQFVPLNEMKLGDVARAIGAGLDPRWAERPFGPVSTDSREIRAGEYFLALRGENFDGHRFVAAALERGAAGVIVDRDYAGPSPADRPILRAADTLRAYGDLAAARRRAWGGPLLAISGSVGKTTTRGLVAAALRQDRRVLEPLRNFNNLIGVPHTLLRLEPDHEIAVLELGMNLPGELRRLAEIADPSVAMLTRIDLTHVGMFASEAELIEAKLDLFRGCRPGTPLVVNAACPRTVAALGLFRDRHPIVAFAGEGEPLAGVEPAIRVVNVEPLAPFGCRFDLVTPELTLAGLELRLFGRHLVENVAAAAAILHAVGEPVELVAEALPKFRAQPLRGQIVHAEGMMFILDCYNASPPSMRSALRTLADLPRPEGGRRLIVLADMLELGDHAREAHQALAEPLRALAPALLFALGPESTALAERMAAEGWEARGFARREELVEALRAAARPGDQVFMKGSHGFGLEHVAHALAPAAGILPH